MKKITNIALILVLSVLAIITATACNSNNIYLSKTDITLEVGASETVTASTKKDGEKAEGTVWSSANAQVATVDGGKITGVSKGSTEITATLNGKSSKVTVKVNNTLGDHKAAKKTELDTYASNKGESNYTAEKWLELQNALTIGKSAVDSAANISEVDTAVTSAKAAIDAVSTKVPARIEIGEVSGTIFETEQVATSVYGQASTFNSSNYKYADISLFKGDTNYSNVRFEISIDTPGAMQLFAKDTSNNWYNVLVTGWGPAEGFSIADATTRLYAVGIMAGTHKITVKLVDVNNANHVILEKTEEVTVNKALSIEVGTVSGSVTVTQPVATTGGKAASFDESKYRHVDITLHKGEATYTNVRFQVSIDTAAALQLFAKDTADNWYNVIETGWGPGGGFAIEDATTRFYAVGLIAGTHTITTKLIDVKDGNKVILTQTGQVTVISA